MNQFDVNLIPSYLTMTRRSFLKTCSILSMCLTGCDQILTKTRYSHLLLNEPHPDDYRPILDNLITTILPFEHAKFPAISPDTIVSRVFDIFPIHAQSRYLALRRSLIFFNEVSLFPKPFSYIIEEEKRRERTWNTTQANRRIVQETETFESFLKISGSQEGAFTSHILQVKRAYFKLWGQSAYGVKRQFYQALKGIIMITAYSMPEMWNTIGYEGPLL